MFNLGTKLHHLNCTHVQVFEEYQNKMNLLSETNISLTMTNSKYLIPDPKYVNMCLVM